MADVLPFIKPKAEPTRKERLAALGVEMEYLEAQAARLMQSKGELTARYVSDISALHMELLGVLKQHRSVGDEINTLLKGVV